MKVFVYGSLRKGGYLHREMKSAKYLGRGVLKGYRMYALTSYPMIVRSFGKVVVEAYDLPVRKFHRLHRIERGAGYTLDYVKVRVRHNSKRKVVSGFVWVWLPDMVDVKKYKYIPSGDWIKYSKEE